MVSDRTLRAVFGSSRFVALTGDLIRVGIAGVVIAAIAFLLVFDDLVWHDRLNDFRVFYDATQQFLVNGDLYGPTVATTVPVANGFHQLWNMNPPHFHLLLVPLVRLPIEQAKTSGS